MKHIFFVHRPFILHFIKKIIENEKINIHDCIIITKEWYIKDINLKDSEHITIKYFEDFKYSNKKDFILKSNKKVREIIGEEQFIFYTSHDKFFSSQIFQFHYNCKGYYYLEEGSASYNTYLFDKFVLQNIIFIFFDLLLSIYTTKKIKKIIHYFRSWFFITFKPNALFHKSPTLLGTCSLTDIAFNFIPSNKNKVFTIDLKEWMYDVNTPVFIFDDLIGANLVNKDTYIEVFKNILKIKKFNKLLIKFHPIQSDNEKAEFCKILNETNTEFNIIGNHISMENYFRLNDLTLIGFFSSVLFYNKILSNNRNVSISYINEILGHSKKMKTKTYLFSIDLMKKSGVIFEDLNQ